MKVLKAVKRICFLAAAVAVAWTMLDGSEELEPLHPGMLDAAIIDQAAFTTRNESFEAEAIEMLENAGYLVDYYGPGNATLDFYRDLPSYGYDLIILRTHAAVGGASPGVDSGPLDAYLFTSTQATREGIKEASRMPGAWMVQYGSPGPGEQEPVYFGLSSVFVKTAMRGDFGGADVLLMGCQTMDLPMMAEAFQTRGAGAVIGWEGQVLPDRNDKALIVLLNEAHGSDSLTWETAAQRTNAAIGPDATYTSSLTIHESAIPYADG